MSKNFPRKTNLKRFPSKKNGLQKNLPKILHTKILIHIQFIFFLPAQSNETVAKAALVCISTIALRVKENADALFDTSIPESIIETMKIHPTSKFVQRNGAWAIRNMVSRSRYQCETWAMHGVEDVLNAALKEHPSIQGDVKSALRDLELKVLLNEEWKGKSEIQITN